MENTEDLLLIVLVIILIFICVLLIVFRKVLVNILQDLFYSSLMISFIFIEIFKDFIHRKKNIQVSVSLVGDVAVVTGARGIGAEVIKKLLESGAHVVIGCRDLHTGEKSIAGIRAAGVTCGTTTCYNLDLSSMRSILTFANNVVSNHPQVHILINNAGVSEKELQLTEDGFERTFAVNYLGHCYLTHLLLTRLAESARTRGIETRIVHVGSVAHRFPVLGKMHFEDLSLSDCYHEYKAYSQSKLAQLMFTKTLGAKLRATSVPVSVFALHPGIVYTSIVSSTMLHKIGAWAYPLLLRTPEEGARTVFYVCASSELKGRNGVYIYNCREAPTGSRSKSVDDQNKLWTTTLNLLSLDNFGGLL